MQDLTNESHFELRDAIDSSTSKTSVFKCPAADEKPCFLPGKPGTLCGGKKTSGSAPEIAQFSVSEKMILQESSPDFTSNRDVSFKVYDECTFSGSSDLFEVANECLCIAKSTDKRVAQFCNKHDVCNKVEGSCGAAGGAGTAGGAPGAPSGPRGGEAGSSGTPGEGGGNKDGRGTGDAIKTDCVGAWANKPGSVCLNGYIDQIYSITTHAAAGGKACDYDPDNPTRRAECGIDCIGSWSGWTPCMDGKTKNTYSISQEAADGGKSCESVPQTETRECGNYCVGGWGVWSECADGQRSRQYSFTTEGLSPDKRCPFRNGKKQSITCGTMFLLSEFFVFERLTLNLF